MTALILFALFEGAAAALDDTFNDEQLAELHADPGLEKAAWGTKSQHIWPDDQCDNLGMHSPELDGVAMTEQACKDLCLKTDLCDTINFNTVINACVMRNCEKYEHPKQHNDWSYPPWVGYRLMIDAPALEARLVAAPTPPKTKLATAESAEKIEMAPEEKAEKKEESLPKRNQISFAEKAAKEEAASENAPAEEIVEDEAEAEKTVENAPAKIAPAEIAISPEPAPKLVPAPAPSVAEVAAITAADEGAEKTVEEKPKKGAEGEAAENKAANKKGAEEKIAAEQVAAEKAAKEKVASEKAASEKADEENAAKEEAPKKKAAKKKPAAEKVAAERALKAEAASEKADEENAAKEDATKKKIVEKKAAAEQAAKEEAAKEKAAELAVQEPPAFSYEGDSTFSNCFATEIRPAANRAFRGVRFHISPDLPEGITLDPETGLISGTYSKDVAKDERGHETTNGKDAEEDGQSAKDIVKRLLFQVEATHVGKQAHTNFNMKLELKHKCPAAPLPGLWVAQILLLILCFAPFLSVLVSVILMIFPNLPRTKFVLALREKAGMPAPLEVGSAENSEMVAISPDEQPLPKTDVVTIDVPTDTYSFPVVVSMNLNSGCSTAIAVCLAVAVFLVEMIVLFGIVKHDLHKLVIDVNTTVRAYQYGALVVVFLALAPDIQGVTDRWKFVLSLMDKEAEAIDKGKKVSASFRLMGLSAFMCALQLISILWAAYASVVYICGMKSASDVALGAFTLTFVINLDELIMQGLLKTFGLSEGSEVMGGTLTWTLPLFKSEMEAEGGDPEEEQLVDNNPSLEKGPHLGAPRSPAEFFFILQRFLMFAVPFCIMWLAACERASLPYKAQDVTVPCNHSGQEWVSVTSRHFCESAGRVLGLRNAKVHGEGICYWNPPTESLYMGAAPRHSGKIQQLCQQSYVVITPSLLGVMTSWFAADEMKHVCAVNQMVDLSHETGSCNAAKEIAYVLDAPVAKLADALRDPIMLMSFSGTSDTGVFKRLTSWVGFDVDKLLPCRKRSNWIDVVCQLPR